MLFYLLQSPAHNSFTFNLRLLYEVKHKVRFSKTVCGIFRFQPRLIFIKVYIFFSTKCMDSLTLLCHNPFKTKIIGKTHSFAPRPLIFKLQQKVLKSNHICVCWSSPKLIWRAITENVTDFPFYKTNFPFY